MKIADLEALLALAKAANCTDIAFWEDRGRTYDIDQTDTTYPLHDIKSHVAPNSTVYSVPLNRTDRDDR